MPHIRANDPTCTAWNKMLMDEFAQKGFYHSIPLPDGQVMEGIVPLDALYDRVNCFPIPESLAGKRVLDIGTWDGFFAFEMERRGAQVVAIDSTEVENFYVARELLGSKAEYHVQDVYELTPERNGYFDLIFFMGVLYHLKHPLYALERVCETCTDMAIVESFVTTEGPGPETPVLEYYETNELLGQIDNWCGPSVNCLLAFCRSAGFCRVNLVRVKAQRAIVACYRHWLPEPEAPTADPPALIAAVHSSNYGVNVSPQKDDYISAFFKSKEETLTLENVFPEVGGYGIRPVSVFNTGEDGWQANFRVPPGLKPGWNEVRVRTAASRFSAPVKIAVNLPAVATSLKITGACDGSTWKPGEVAAGDDAFISLWAAGLPANADRGNVKVFLGTKKLPISHFAPDAGNAEPRQINVKIPRSFPQGRHELTLRLGETVSEPLAFRVVQP